VKDLVDEKKDDFGGAFKASGIGHDRSALHFDNALSPSVFLLLPNI
jgi:hypothetical protein